MVPLVWSTLGIPSLCLVWLQPSCQATSCMECPATLLPALASARAPQALSTLRCARLQPLHFSHPAMARFTQRAQKPHWLAPILALAVPAECPKCRAPQDPPGLYPSSTLATPPRHHLCRVLVYTHSAFAIPPRCILCVGCQDTSPCTYISFPARESSMWSASGPPHCVHFGPSHPARAAPAQSSPQPPAHASHSSSQPVKVTKHTVYTGITIHESIQD